MKITLIRRGGIVAVRDGDVLEIWLGEHESPESEMIASFHLSYLNEIVGALLAVKSVLRR